MGEADGSRGAGLTRPVIAMFVIAALVAMLSLGAGLNGQQVLSVTIFTLIVLGTLFFWSFRPTSISLSLSKRSSSWESSLPLHRSLWPSSLLWLTWGGSTVSGTCSPLSER